MTDATEDYLGEQDNVGVWLDECCAVDANGKELSSTLFKSYRDFAIARGEVIGTQKDFVEALERRFKRSRRSGGVMFFGLRLRHVPPWGDAASGASEREDTLEPEGVV